MGESMRLVVVPGVTPAKWVRVWRERLPRVPITIVPVAADEGAAAVAGAGGTSISPGSEGTDEGEVTVTGLVRLPVDPELLNAIPLYEERTVVVVPLDHAVTDTDEVMLDDLASEIVLHPLDDVLAWATSGASPEAASLPGEPAAERPATTAAAVELVAAGIGVLLVPQSLARLHQRKDVTYRPVLDAPTSTVALAWPWAYDAPDLVEELIGIVRGRTANSSRGRGAQAASAEAAAATPRAKGATQQGRGTGARGGGKSVTGKSATGKAATGKGRQPRTPGARPARPARKGPRRSGR